MPSPPSSLHTIRAFYLTLLQQWGKQNWWPARSPFEVIVGAYLTQNTAWYNVEKAIANLHGARVLSVKGIREIPQRKLERLIQSSGYFRQKARRLKIFVKFLDLHYQGSLKRMLAQPVEKLRTELLGLNGIGPETADSILLYAGNHPVFVVDAYTRRILERHGIVPSKASYEEIRALMEEAISKADAEILRLQQPGSEPRHPVSPMSCAPRADLAQHYNEFHALIVRTGNQYCRSMAQCQGCPLQPFLSRLSGTTVRRSAES
jgi:endonuclease III related protein